MVLEEDAQSIVDWIAYEVDWSDKSGNERLIAITQMHEEGGRQRHERR